jgi:hypothetical protein
VFTPGKVLALMHSKNSQSIASRGSVQTKVSNGRLQLVFSHPIVTPSGELKNKRFYLSTRHEDICKKVAIAFDIDPIS